VRAAGAGAAGAEGAAGAPRRQGCIDREAGCDHALPVYLFPVDPVRLSSQPIYASKRFTLAEERFKTVDGEVARQIIHHPGAVAVIAQPTATTLVLVKQYRYAIQRWTWEIPAGTREANEAPELTAGRELIEESGYRAERLRELLRFIPAVGISDEELIVYRAEGLSEVPAAPEHGELVSRAVVELSELPALLARGDLADAKTLIGLAILGIPLVRA
jgi:8-oxo-dGTP pyrophosphatase MutT (NUDIX family)